MILTKLMNISSINIIGAGAIGRYLYTALSTSFDVSLYSARSLSAINDDLTYVINGNQGSISISSLPTLEPADLTIYSGLLNTFPYSKLEASHVTLCSNLSGFLQLHAVFYSYSAIAFIQAEYIASNVSAPNLLYVTTPHKPCLMVSRPLPIDSLPLLDIKYDPSCNCILEKSLRTLFYVLFFSYKFNLDIKKLSQDFNMIYPSSSFLSSCLSILTKLPSDFAPSILRDTKSQRNELKLLMQLFDDFIRTHHPSLLSSYTVNVLKSITVD